ncbi:PAS domain-containing hybrid sensor histidine kinase/response regulator [Arthrobacter globiformis]|uniref:PAS domain-containing hybrid sensor histidine kinase/response regulator n=1 Tax=Arthrobacter globiformis TaxID=1665 RepID=UPI002790A734|nr:response regulator [Arthrobacter globiformis]MDQ0618384.1 two-component system sensor histidine kinase/response regulator [Arthrobacter globiformis]
MLIALAPLTPQGQTVRPESRVYALALELLPYLPVIGAVLVFAGPHVHELDPFLVVAGTAGLVLVLARQMLIIFENNRLTTGLERDVVARTKELEGLAAIVNSSADAIIGLNPEGVVTSWNPGAEKLYGYSAADVIGTDVGFLLPEHRRPGKLRALAAIAEGLGSRSYESEFLRQDGSLVPVSLTISPIRGAKGLSGIATIAQDITQRKAAEQELQAAREAALESSRLKSEFLATMSHEIRTPMNGVIGLTSLLMETPLDETQRQYAEGIKGAGEALVALINDILDFSKLEAGKVDLDVRPFDVRLLVEEAAGLLAEPAQAKGLELTAFCAPEVPARLSGDAGRIRQILLNLATNAVKFTEAGEVAIQVTSAEDGVGRAMVTFEVRDTGIGIDPSDQSRLFQSFIQADASTTRRYGGTGLGLAICSRLTEAMGGTIGLDSMPGEGSTFWFSLPLPVAERTPPCPAPEALTGLRVLVVDDNATNRLILESQLRSWQLRPDTAADARAALSRAKEAAGTADPYEIAVLDLCMPDMDGLEIARAMTADPALASIRIILLTSTRRIDKDQFTAAGVREWLMKPVRSSEFYNRLIRLIASPNPVAKAHTPAVAGPPQEQGVAARGRILVVEDNEVNQLVAQGMVSRLGFAVDLASNGAEAVAATAATEYAAVLMDCHMPVMDGYEATRLIRRRDTGAARIPIVAMTAGALDGDRERCLAAGMDDYLAKPVDLGQLAALLERWAPGTPTPRTGSMSLDPDRLAVLRDLGPDDGHGLLPAMPEAFQRDLPGGPRE